MSANGSRRVTGDGRDRPAVARRTRWSDAPPVFQLSAATVLPPPAPVPCAWSDSPEPFVDERVALAALGLPALADDDDFPEETTR